MTPDEIRVKVAEAMGFTNIRFSTPWELTDHPDDPVVLVGKQLGLELKAVPCFTHDLNACAEFEATLSASESVVYDGWLMTLGGFDRAIKIHSPDGKPTDDFVRLIRCVRSAPPLRRCEAFLRARNLWTTKNL